MPGKELSDPITDQEIAFAHLVLSGAMTDRRAAEAVGLNPDAAAYTKAKPGVRDYIIQHRAAVQQQPVQQEVDLYRSAVDGLRHFTLDREQVLVRLWQIANLGPELTRGSVTGQVKSLSIIVAMENFIPDRRAASAEKKSAPAPTAQIYKSEWLREQQAAAQAKTNGPQPTHPPAQVEDRKEDSHVVAACPGEPAPNSVAEAPSDPGPSQPAFAHRVPLADGLPPYIPGSAFVPDTRVPFSIKKNPFARRRP